MAPTKDLLNYLGVSSDMNSFLRPFFFSINCIPSSKLLLEAVLVCLVTKAVKAH